MIFYLNKMKKSSFYYGACIGAMLLLTGCPVDSGQMINTIGGNLQGLLTDGATGSLKGIYNNMTSSGLNVAATPNFNPQRIRKVAVVMRPDKNYRGVPYRRVEDQFMLDLMKKGYQVASRSDVKQIVEEMSFQGSSLTEDRIANIGKILNVSVVLIVSITDLQSSGGEVSATLGTRLIGVERAELLWGGSCSGKGSQIGGTLEKLAKKIAGAFPVKNSSR